MQFQKQEETEEKNSSISYFLLFRIVNINCIKQINKYKVKPAQTTIATIKSRGIYNSSTPLSAKNVNKSDP